MASLCSSWSWIIVMTAGALPFVIAVARRAMLILVSAAVRAIIMARLFPMFGLAISTGFPSWRLVSPASVTTPSPLAIVVAYDDTSLWDFKLLILWWRHIGLMAGRDLVLVVSISRIVLVGWRWISLMTFAMWLIIGGYWDGICPVTSFSSSGL
jgi:hypothetical protein